MDSLDGVQHVLIIGWLFTQFQAHEPKHIVVVSTLGSEYKRGAFTLTFSGLDLESKEEEVLPLADGWILDLK